MKVVETAGRQEYAKILPKNSIGAELGVRGGENARKLLRQLQPTELHLIDSWTVSHLRFPEFKRRVKKIEFDLYREKVIRIFESEISDGLVKIYDDKIENVMPTFDDNYFDWVYIDAEHTFEAVTADIEISYQKLKNNGILCGHDFHVLTKRRLGGMGVIRAVINFIQSGRGQMIALGNNRLECGPDWFVRISK